MMVKSSSNYSRLMQILDAFGGVGASKYGSFKDEFGILKKKDVSVCTRCQKKVEENACPYCQETGYLTTETKSAIETTLDGKLLGNALGKILISEGLTTTIDAVEDIENGIYLKLVLHNNMKTAIMIFGSTDIGEETFRQNVSIMTKEKDRDYLIFLCKKFNGNIAKILNFYPKVKIGTFSEIKSCKTFFSEASEAFLALEKLNLKTIPLLFSESEDVSVAIKRAKEIILKINHDEKSDAALGNDFEIQMKKVLGYFFTAWDISDRDNLPELIIFDHSGGFYLVDIKSGQYNSSEYRKVQSYATSYYELAIGNQNSLNIKGVVVPNIMWMTRGESINSAFTEFAKNYAGFKSDVGITLIDAEAILRLAELKSTMTNNCYTCILLNLESIFQKGRISVGDVERIVNEAQNKISSKEDAITKSLQQSRAKFFP